MSLLRGARGPRKVVALGATSGMGRALARRMAARGDRVFLLGHDPDELERSAGDLTVRAGGASEAGRALCDLERPETFAPALDAADEALGGFDTVVVSAAMFAPQERLEDDAELTV